MARPARLRGRIAMKVNQRDNAVELVGVDAGLQIEVEVVQVVLPGAGEDVEQLVEDVVGQNMYSSNLLVVVVLRSIVCKVLPR